MKFRSIFLITLLLSIFNLFILENIPVFSQSEELPPSPLELPVSDPLLPGIDRPMTPFEQRRLRDRLAEMSLEAQAEMDQGNAVAAWEIWYKELRLWQKLTTVEEVQALGRIGKGAWDRGESEQVQIITQRLAKIQQENIEANTITPDLLSALATAYQNIREINRAIFVEEQILQNAQASQDKAAEETSLKILGELYLAKFDYPNASVIYEQLLTQAQAAGNTYEEGIYLQKLAEIYTQSSQPENSIKIKKDLADSYLAERKINLIPNLRISIAMDYEAIDQLESASQNYQEAFALAWSLEQFGAAGEALKKLGKLYERTEQLEFALQIYQELIKVEQASYNYYGLMETYDRIGLIYQDNSQYDAALIAFNQGLELARAISYKEEYFFTKIQEVNLQKQGIPIPE
ncbi:MAG: tetratricopeptide repeat protein [Microcystaceae cyanobacterium]